MRRPCRVRTLPTHYGLDRRISRSELAPEPPRSKHMSLMQLALNRFALCAECRHTEASCYSLTYAEPSPHDGTPRARVPRPSSIRRMTGSGHFERGLLSRIHKTQRPKTMPSSDPLKYLTPSADSRTSTEPIWTQAFMQAPIQRLGGWTLGQIGYSRFSRTRRYPREPRSQKAG